MGLFSRTENAAPTLAAPAPKAETRASAPKPNGKGSHEVENVGDFVKATFSSEHFGGFGFWKVPDGRDIFMFHKVFSASGYSKAEKDKLAKGNATAMIRFGDRVGGDGEYEAVEIRDLTFA